MPTHPWHIESSETLLLKLQLLFCSQVSPAVPLDKLKESWKLYMMECDHNNSQELPSVGEPNTLGLIFFNIRI